MATTIPEQIAVKLKARLETITTGNGYENTVSEVIRPTWKGEEIHPKDDQIILTQGTQSWSPELSHAGNPGAWAWQLPFEISGGLRPSETSITPIDTFRNQFLGDIHRAIGGDGSATWPNWIVTGKH